MFSRYPRAIFRDRRVILSKEELQMAIKEGAQARKECIMSLYSFSAVLDNKPVWEKVIIDCILWEGKEDFCRSMIRKFSSYPSLLIFDGSIYQAIVFKESTQEELQRLHANSNLGKMILVPGTLNLRTGKKCRIVEKFK